MKQRFAVLAGLQDVLPGEFQLLLRHGKVNEPFDITVEAQGEIVKESLAIRSTKPDVSQFDYVVDNHELVWEVTELGKVVISGTGLQSCHIRFFNIHCEELKAGWALDYLELKRIA